MPGLWLFLLIVVAVLLFVVGLTSLSMHLLQYRYRQNLRRRVENGEVDLEALGVKRLTVPKEVLNKFPITVYIAHPPTPSLPSQTSTIGEGHGPTATSALPVGSVDGVVANHTETGQTRQFYQPSCPVRIIRFPFL